MTAAARSLASLALPLAVAAAPGLLASGCGDPETALAGCWREVEWRYERTSGDDEPGRWTDGVRSRTYPDRQLVRHRHEHWRIGPDGTLELAGEGGRVVHARWRLKGRGHALVLRYPGDDALEVYDIEELDERRLILQYELGMEARGIARLRFERIADGTACAPRTAVSQAASRERRSS